MGRQFYNHFNHRNQRFLDYRARISIAAKQITLATKKIKISNLTNLQKRQLLTSIINLEDKLAKEPNIKLVTKKYEALGTMLTTVITETNSTHDKIREMTNFLDQYRRPSTKSTQVTKSIFAITLLAITAALIISAIYVMPVIIVGVTALASFSSIALAFITLRAFFNKIIIPFSKLIQRFSAEYKLAVGLDARIEQLMLHTPALDADDPADAPDIPDLDDKEDDEVEEEESTSAAMI